MSGAGQRPSTLAGTMLVTKAGDILPVGAEPSVLLPVFEGVAIRTLTIDGKAWFSAKDILAVLAIKGSTNAQLAKLAPEMKRTLTKGGIIHYQIGDDRGLFPGRVSRHVVVSREGVTRLVMRSDKPSAIRFQDWLAGVVAEIDDHGGYIRGQENLTPEKVAVVREGTRRAAGLIAAEEREARSDAFAFLKGRPQRLR